MKDSTGRRRLAGEMDDVQFCSRVTGGENLLLMGRYKKGKYEHSMFGALTDIHIWDSVLSLDPVRNWMNFSSTIKGAHCY